MDEFGVEIIAAFEAGLNPDGVCQAIDVCTSPQCLLWPHTKRTPATRRARREGKRKRFDPWAWLKALLATFEAHKPEFDFDGDMFVSQATLRGYNWRGADCRPFDSSVHPGRRVGVAGDDYDCNGISGFDPATSRPWKDVLCDGVPHLGVIGAAWRHTLTRCTHVHT